MKSLIFQDWGIRAIMDGRKTQTRRITHQCRFAVGDKFYAREAWQEFDGIIKFRATLSGADRWRWRSPLHLAEKDARIFCEVVSLRTERVQYISEEDAKAEGVEPEKTYRRGFQAVWEKINGEKAWSENPYVFRIEFKVVKGGVR